MRIYVYRVGNKFIKVTGLDLSLTSSLKQASYWEGKRTANSWKRGILEKYPNAELLPAKLVKVLDV